MSHVTRRRFLKSSAALGAFTFLPAHIARGSQASSGVAPSEKLNLAFVGIAHRGARSLRAFLSTGMVNVVALCDIDMIQQGAQEAVAAHPQAKRFTDFRKMFDAMDSEIDAVVVSTPDHSHFAITMHAMMAGKHVWCEKPLAHTFGQCERLMAMAEKTGVVTQMGNQGHSSANRTQFEAWTNAGVIKDVTRITAFMNKERRWHGWGPGTAAYPQDPMPAGIDWDPWMASAVEHPFSDKLHPGNWRSWFDYGSGCFGDWGPHILDTAHRFLKLGYPETVAAAHRDGLSDLVYPEATTVKFKFGARGDMPPCEITWHDGQQNIPEVEHELGTLDKATGQRTPLSLGAPGKIIYGKDLTFMGGSHAKVLQVVPRDKYLDIRRDLPRFESKVSGHWENFLYACKGQEEANSPFGISAPLSQVFNLGVLAQRFGGELKFDAKTKQITNHDVANALLDPPPRKGWEHYYEA